MRPTQTQRYAVLGCEERSVLLCAFECSCVRVHVFVLMCVFIIVCVLVNVCVCV